MGIYYITAKKGIKRASADVELLLAAFNLSRLMNIVDKKVFFSYLKKLTLFLIALLPVLSSTIVLFFRSAPNSFSISSL